MPIHAIIVDLMDVLALDEGPERSQWEARAGLPDGSLMRTMFRSPLFREAIMGHVPEADVWRDVARAFDRDPQEWRELAETFYSAFRLNHDLVAFIRALRPRYKTAILSNTPSDIRTLLTERFHLEREVDTVIISAEEHLKKPQPEFYQLAAERLGVPLQENLFLDDESRYVEAARSLGMSTVQFINNAQAIPAMQQVLQVSG